MPTTPRYASLSKHGKKKKSKRRLAVANEEAYKSRYRRNKVTVINEEEKNALTSDGNSLESRALQPSLDIEKDDNQLLTTNGNSLPDVQSQQRGSRIRRISNGCNGCWKKYCGGYTPHATFFICWILSALIVAEIFHRPSVSSVSTHPPTPSDIVLDGYDDQIFKPEGRPYHPPHGETPRGKALLEHFRILSGEKVMKAGTAQYEAAHWIISVDELTLFFDDPLLNQRYVLALMYFEMMVDSLDDTSVLPGGNKSKVLREWLDPTKSECSWTGIKCNVHGYVDHIQLDDRGLHGQIPEEIWVFQHLSYLDLSNNQISGKIPKEIGLLQKLSILFLENNYMTGAVDSSLCARREEGVLELFTTDCIARGSSSSIKRVYCNCCTNCVSDNKEPDSGWGAASDHKGNDDNIDIARKQKIFGKCSQISGIAVSQLHTPQSMATNWMIYEDKLQLEIDSPHFVQRYVIAVMIFSLQRDFTGKILLNPIVHECSFESITCNSSQQVEEIRLGRSDLEGTLPPELSLLNGIKIIELTDNKISGGVPESWGALVNLEELLLKENELTGVVPSSICALHDSNLNRFDVDCMNYECSCCTNCIEDLDNESLDEKSSSNDYMDSEDLNTEDLENEEMSNEEINAREEDIQYVLSVENKLKTYNAPTVEAFNWIVDRDPMKLDPHSESLVQRYVLAVIYFSFNSLGWDANGDDWMTGISECKWKGVKCDDSSRVIGLELTNKHLSGNIPDEIGNLPYLTSIDLSDNQITGDVPKALGKLYLLEILILDENKMKGEVPHQVCSLKEDYSLNFISVDCSLDRGEYRVSCTCCNRCSHN